MPDKVSSRMRKRVLFLSQCLPFPPHSGVTNRTYHILQELERAFDVTLIAFSRRNHQPDSAARSSSTEKLRKEVTRVMEPVPIESEWSVPARLKVHSSSLLSGKPYTFFDYGNPEFGRQIRLAVERARPDIVHMDSMDLYRWLPLLPEVPIACTHHNVESELLRSRADRIERRLLSAYIRHQGDLVESVERELCGRFDLNITTSDTDARRLEALAPTARTSVIPNGVDVDFFCPTPAQQIVPGRVVFLGPTYMFPNRDAVQFFLGSMWGQIQHDEPAATLHVIGKNGSGDKDNFEGSPAVVCHGYVPDVRPHFAEAACSIVPLRVGGGTRLKILDAWAMGKAIVSTSVGCEGLETIDGGNILIRDDPGEFASAVSQVLRDESLRNRLARNGRRTAEEVYAWPVVGRKLNALYEALLGAGGRRALAS